MARVLAVDYGRTYWGLAFSEGYLVDPLTPIKRTKKKLHELHLMQQLIQSNRVEIVVWGLPKGVLRAEITTIAETIHGTTHLPFVFEDEHNSSIVARGQAKAAGKSLKRLGSQEHSLAACVILESYLTKVKKN